MRIYLIRHGESNAEELNKVQGVHNPLSEKGKEQIQRIANFLFDKNIYAVFSSDLKRAVSSAEIIIQKLNLDMIISNDLKEKELNPKLNEEMKLNDSVYQQYLKENLKNFTNFDWLFLGEGETTKDVFNRADKFKYQLLKDYSDKNVAVVTHGHFIRCFISICLFNEAFESPEFQVFFKSITFDNGSMSILDFYTAYNSWKLRSLNCTLE
jgi:broad specificity phosphatase PhoE